MQYVQTGFIQEASKNKLHEIDTVLGKTWNSREEIESLIFGEYWINVAVLSLDEGDTVPGTWYVILQELRLWPFQGYNGDKVVKTVVRRYNFLKVAILAEKMKFPRFPESKSSYKEVGVSPQLQQFWNYLARIYFELLPKQYWLMGA